MSIPSPKLFWGVRDKVFHLILAGFPSGVCIARGDIPQCSDWVPSNYQLSHPFRVIQLSLWMLCFLPRLNSYQSPLSGWYQ
jgi:hypothetical protein